MPTSTLPPPPVYQAPVDVYQAPVSMMQSDMMQSDGAPMATGVAIRWCANGYGFIRPDDGGEDLFCHSSSITDGNMLKEGAAVQFVKRIHEPKGKEQAFDRNSFTISCAFYS